LGVYFVSDWFWSRYIFLNAYPFGLCVKYDPECHRLLMDNGIRLFYGMGALALVFLILLFVPQAVSAWKKFAIWYVPIAAWQLRPLGQQDMQ